MREPSTRGWSWPWRTSTQVTFSTLLLTPLLSFSPFLTFATHNLPHSHTGRVGHPRRLLHSWSLTHSHEYSYTRILLWNPASFTHFIHEQRSCSSGNGDGHFAMRCDTDFFRYTLPSLLNFTCGLQLLSLKKSVNRNSNWFTTKGHKFWTNEKILAHWLK